MVSILLKRCELHRAVMSAAPQNPPRSRHGSPMDRPPLVPYTAVSAVPPQLLSLGVLATLHTLYEDRDF